MFMHSLQVSVLELHDNAHHKGVLLLQSILSLAHVWTEVLRHKHDWRERERERERVNQKQHDKTHILDRVFNQYTVKFLRHPTHLFFTSHIIVRRLLHFT